MFKNIRCVESYDPTHYFTNKKRGKAELVPPLPRWNAYCKVKVYICIPYQEIWERVKQAFETFSFPITNTQITNNQTLDIIQKKFYTYYNSRRKYEFSKEYRSF